MKKKLQQFKIKIKYDDSCSYLCNFLKYYWGKKSFKKYGVEFLWDIARRYVREEMMLEERAEEYSFKNHIKRINCIFKNLYLPETLVTKDSSKFSKRRYIQLFNSLIMQAAYFVLAMKEEAFKQENVINILSLCRKIVGMPFMPADLKKECTGAIEFIFKAFIPPHRGCKERRFPSFYLQLLKDYEDIKKLGKRHKGYLTAHQHALQVVANKYGVSPSALNIKFLPEARQKKKFLEENGFLQFYEPLLK